MSKSKKFYQESSVEGVHSADYPWKPGVSVAGRYTREAGSARDIGKEDEAKRNEALARKIHQSNLKEMRSMEKPNLTKSNLPDWTEWILEKNAKAQEEALKKSDSVEVESLDLQKGRKTPVTKEEWEAPRGKNESKQDHMIRQIRGWGTTTKDYRHPVSGEKGRDIEKISPTKTRVHFDPQGYSHDDAKHFVESGGHGRIVSAGESHFDVEHD